MANLDEDNEILSFNKPEPILEPEETIEPQVIEQEPEPDAGVGENSEEENVVYSDHDEEKMSKLYEEGKRHITASELMGAGITTQRISPHKFRIGRFLLSREWLISPYKITKVL